VSRVADLSLAPEGQRRIDWAWQHMPVLQRLGSERLADGTLRGNRIAVVVHLEAKTACLALALRERAPRQRGLALGAVLAPFATLGSFALYLGQTLHDPFAWTHAERAWGRQFTPFGLIATIRALPRAVEGNPWVLRDVLCLLVYVALLWAAFRAGAPRAWIAAGALVAILPTFSGSFHSIGRFGLLAPAMFWGLAALGAQRRADAAIRALGTVLLVAGTVSLAWVFP